MKKIIVLIFTLLSASVMLMSQSQTYSFAYTCQDGQTLFLKISDEGGSTVTVVSQNNGNNRYERPLSGRIDIPAQVDHDGNRYVVTAIGDKAFMGCRDLSVVIMPSTIKTIGTYAFANCSGLTTIQFSSSLEVIGSSAFSNCLRLAGPLVIPSRTKKIGSYAFSGCSSLSSLQMPESLEEIGSYTFKGCSGLRGSITLTPGLKSLGNNAFADCSHLSGIRFYGNDELHMGTQSSPVFAGCVGILSVTIGDNVKVIPENAFKGCTALKEVNLPQGLTAIGHSAFAQCSNLEGDLVIPANVKTIGGSAFYGCRSLQSLRLSDGLTEIGDYTFFQCSGLEGRLILPEEVVRVGSAAFKGCSGLEGTLSLPAGLKHIGAEAFMGCEHLTGTLTIPVGMEYIGNSAFADCRRLQAIEYGAEDCQSMGAIGHTAFHGCTGIKSITIFHGVKQIPNCAFSNCTGVEGEIKIPAGVTSIGSNAFSGCTQITGIEFPEELIQIKNGAFRGCTRLDGTLTLPTHVESIGNNAFENCISITAISLDGYPPRLGADAFNGVNSLIPVTVPCKSLLSYQNSEGWRYFSHLEGSSSENRLTARSADDDMGSVRIIQSNTCSFAHAMIQAIPNEGYVFAGWADGNRDNPRSVVVSSDTIMEAFFEEGSLVSIIGVSNDGALGMVTGGGDYEKGSEVTLVAVAYAGTTFEGWNDGNLDNPRKLSALANGRYLALFSNAKQSLTPQPPTPDTDDTLYPITDDNGSITVEGVKGHTVTVYDDYGRQVTKEEDCSDIFHYKPSSPGNYLIRIDTGETRRIVIE